MRHGLRSVILSLSNLQRAVVALFPVYLLRLTVGFAAVVHEARTVALQRGVNDLKGQKKEFRDFGKQLFSVPHLTSTYLVVFKGHEVVVYVFVASIFFHSHLEFFVVQHFSAIFQHKSVTVKKTKAVHLHNMTICFQSSLAN